MPIFDGNAVVKVEGTLASPGLFSSAATAPYLAAYVTVHQGGTTPDNWFQTVWGIEWELVSGTPSYSSFTEHRYGTDYASEIKGPALDISGAGSLLFSDRASGDMGAAVLSGNPVRIVQDAPDDQLTFDTPLGFHVESLAGLGLNNTNPLMYQTSHIAQRFTVFDPPFDTHLPRITVQTAAWASISRLRPAGPALSWMRCDFDAPLTWSF